MDEQIYSRLFEFNLFILNNASLLASDGEELVHHTPPTIINVMRGYAPGGVGNGNTLVGKSLPFTEVKVKSQNSTLFFLVWVVKQLLHVLPNIIKTCANTKKTFSKANL